MPTLAAEGLDARSALSCWRAGSPRDAAIEAAVHDGRSSRLGSRPGAACSIAFDARGLRDLPAEIALRLVGRATGVVGDEGPVELGKLESLCESLLRSWTGRTHRFRRTLAGAMVSRCSAIV